MEHPVCTRTHRDFCLVALDISAAMRQGVLNALCDAGAQLDRPGRWCKHRLGLRHSARAEPKDWGCPEHRTGQVCDLCPLHGKSEGQL
jgi:hypothetical protein